MEPKQGKLEQTAESLKLLGAGTPYQSTNSMTINEGPTSIYHVKGISDPWGQRHPQGPWKPVSPKQTN